MRPIDSFHPAGVVGRVIAAIGAGVMALSLFLTAYNTEDGTSYWEAFRRMDVLVLVLAVAVIVLLAVSFTALEIGCLFLVGAIGGYGIGLFFFDVFESAVDESIGAYLANLGSGLIVAGAGLALLPVMLAGTTRLLPFAYAPAEPVQQATPATPALAPEPTAPVTDTPVAAPAAGWYDDPSGRARLRYWDGQAWTEQTQ
jgi:Protein of unknown function (DUF2510)